MIRSVAFCPHPPLLIPAVAGGAAAELDELRAACRSVVRSAATAVEALVLLGTGPTAGAYPAGAQGTLRPYGVDLDIVLGAATSATSQLLPLSLTIGAWLIADVNPGVPVRALAVTASDVDTELGPGDVGLVVLGDGSARRSRTAPGYLDERAAGFDAQVAAALTGGDADALSRIDLALGAELLAAGTPAWRAAGRLLAGGDYAARLLYNAAPYGVGYFVAEWHRRG